MQRFLSIGAVLGGVAVLCWLVPPFHIVSLKEAQAVRAEAKFDPARYADEFWANQLTPAFAQAADASAVLKALGGDAKSAMSRHGRTLGLSDTALFFIQGSGTIVSVGTKGVGVSLRGPDGEADLLLKTGLLFGNTIRDATGLIDGNQFPNSQDFNAISTELNRIVETRVLSGFKTNAVVGRSLRFVGVAELTEDEASDRPVKVTPLLTELK